MRSDDAADVLPDGRDIVCAGYAIYGPSTMLVLTFGERVDGFTLDEARDCFVLTHPEMIIPEQANEFAINVSRQRHWDPIIKDYVAGCIDGPAGHRGKVFNMRWTASMVSEVHRILVRGGVFSIHWIRITKRLVASCAFSMRPCQWLWLLRQQVVAQQTVTARFLT
jgi:fructose-1,6-bisphosphatase I